MPRIRTIKPEFWSSPSTAQASPWARLLFIAMWCWADDWGRAEWTPRGLLGFAFPNDTEAPCIDAEVPRLCAEVADAFDVAFYTIGRRRYFAIPSWEDHQRNQRRAQSRIPTPDHPKALPDKEIESLRGTSVRPHGTSVQLHGTVVSGTGEQGNRGTGEQGKKTCPTPIDGGNVELPDGVAPARRGRASGDQGELMFEAFWDAYAFKVDKVEAREAWAAATKQAPAAQIIEAAARLAPRYAARKRVKGTQVLSPARWLRRQKWLDDPDAVFAAEDLAPLTRSETTTAILASGTYTPPWQARAIEGGGA